ncbi:MAG: CTP synthase, partial [Anaeroplasmataceae bacterium]|nr:CTP synthase [Anaeroplasmataceae bacterium]
IQAATESQADVVITEIGGTVGDIESLPFLEAIRQARRDFGYHNTLYIHNTLVPYLKAAGEIKTKPTQHSVKELRSLGIQPDMIILRTEVSIEKEQKEKIALFCDVDREAVFEAMDSKILFEVVNSLHNQKIDDIILKHFELDLPPADMTEWNSLIEKIKNLKDEVKIALVGKYISLPDAYISVNEALKAAGYYHNVKVNIVPIDSNEVNEENVEEQLKSFAGVIVPGGFGKRGSDGKILAIQYCRTHKIPFFGICFGMQLACIEYAKNAKGYQYASSTEIDPDTPHPIIHQLSNQHKDMDMGGTLRLGLYSCKLKSDTNTYKAYGAEYIQERHRHRYEFNSAFSDVFDDDFIISGINEETQLVEIIELRNHPWFVACQFHPEFVSRPYRPHPLFRDFIGASILKLGK